METNSLFKITSHTRTLAVIGDPISHSMTPRIQNVALREAGIDMVTVALRVKPEGLKNAVEGARDLGFVGFMVTIPHKESILEFCDELDESSQLMGAANLLRFDGDKVNGYTTDGWAAVKSMREEGVEVTGAKLAVLGGGGAARTLALTFAREGAKQIFILNRTLERADSIAREVRELGVEAETGTLEENNLKTVLAGVDVLVNSTSVGMSPKVEFSPVPASCLHKDMAVYDIVYNPMETRLLREARAIGSKTVDGLGMLIHANVRAVEICLGKDISAATMRREALEALGKDKSAASIRSDALSALAAGARLAG